MSNFQHFRFSKSEHWQSLNDSKIAPGLLGNNLNTVLKSGDDAAQGEIFDIQIGRSSQLDHGDHVWFGPKKEN